MDREHEIYSIEVEVFKSGVTNEDVIMIYWEADCGWGEYQLYKENGKWKADSECMDSGDDKNFLRQIMNKFIDEIEVIE